MINHIFTPFLQIFKIVLEISFHRLIRGNQMCRIRSFTLYNVLDNYFTIFFTPWIKYCPEVQAVISDFFSIIGIVQYNWMILDKV